MEPLKVSTCEPEGESRQQTTAKHGGDMRGGLQGGNAIRIVLVGKIKMCHHNQDGQTPYTIINFLVSYRIF